MKKFIVSLIFAVLLILTSMPAAYAQDNNIYTIDTGTLDAGFGYISNDRLIRWPNGVLWTVYTSQYTTAQEVYVAYSPDNGINWYETRITNVGLDQYNPCISTTSDWDLHIAWHGKGGGDYPAVNTVKYIHGDYDQNTGLFDWGSIEYVKDESTESKYADIKVDGKDNIHLAWHNMAGSRYVYYSFKEKSATGWESWSVADEIWDVVTAEGVAIAVDQNNDVGIIYNNNNDHIRFKQRDHNTGTWGAAETAYTNTGATTLRPLDIIASIYGGDTVWRIAIQDHTGTNYSAKYIERPIGGWQSPVTMEVYDGYNLCLAQENGESGDTGNFYYLMADISGVNQGFQYKKYTNGVGWDASWTEISTSENRALSQFSVTNVLYPDSPWYWNLSIQGFAGVFYDGGAVAGVNGDEIEFYFESYDAWGGFPPYVVTGEPINITQTSCTFVGYHFGGNITERGFQYGYTQTATWTVSESGNWCASELCLTEDQAEFTIEITDLDIDTIYYVRAVATNADDTAYGDWEGFLTSPQTYTGNETGVDTEPESIIPDLPEEPDEWFHDSEPSYSESGGSGEIIGVAFFNEIFGYSGHPVGFIWDIGMCLLILISTYIVYKKTQHSLMVGITGAFLLGIFASLHWLPWWYLFPYIIMIVNQLIIEKDYGL